MTPDTFAVLKACPPSSRAAATTGRIAGNVEDMEPAHVGQRLKMLAAMGLVENIAGAWSRTERGDREAGREGHGR